MLITFALPAYNEEGNIDKVLAGCVAALSALPHKWEIVVIDNASTDNTAQRVLDFSTRHPEVRLISHETNRLYAGSCETALRQARGDRIAIMDSDGQHTPEDVMKFMNKMDEGFGLIIGWRRNRFDPIARRIFSAIFNLMGRFYLSYPLHDLNCGFRMLDKAFAEQTHIKRRINLSNPEFFVSAMRHNVRVGEVEVMHYPRENGTSAMSTMSIARIIQMFGAVRRYFVELNAELKTNPSGPQSIR
jgi:glycosyltransferase involved in cell wall biosynthesis